MLNLNKIQLKKSAKFYKIVTFLFLWSLFTFFSFKIWAKVIPILGIHSYSADFPWTSMIIEAYEIELKKSPLSYSLNNLYFDAKKNPFKGVGPHPLVPEIVTQIKKLKPELIFLTDDLALAQVGPILVKEKIPFVFAGINGENPRFYLKVFL